MQNFNPNEFNKDTDRKLCSNPKFRLGQDMLHIYSDGGLSISVNNLYIFSFLQENKMNIVFDTKDPYIQGTFLFDATNQPKTLNEYEEWLAISDENQTKKFGKSDLIENKFYKREDGSVILYIGERYLVHMTRNNNMD